MYEGDMSTKKPIGTRDWYDFIGLLADAIPFIHQGGKEATDALLELCQLSEGSDVLDVGCGAGSTACVIAERFGSTVQGIDISEVMISKAEDRARTRGLTDRVTFRVGNVFDLPFEDDSFDVVIVESVLMPLPGDKKAAMKEMIRVVRPGGLVGANEATIDPSTSLEILSQLEEHPAMYGYFTPQTLQDLFEESGLRVLQMTETWNVEAPKGLQGMAFRDMVSFMVRVYPKIVINLLRDQRLRRASKIDDKVTKLLKQHAGYALIVGQKSQ